jgi:serine protease Do
MTFDNEQELQEEVTEQLINDVSADEVDFEQSEQEQTPVTPVAETGEEKPKKVKKTWSVTKAVALILVCSLLSGMIGAAAAIFLPKIIKGKTFIYVGTHAPMELEEIQVGTDKVLTPAQVYAANVEATVGIQTSITTNYWGYQTTAAAAGSGFVLTPDGFVATNYHVVDNANSIKVTMYDGTAYPAFLVGFDEEHDFAVLKIDAEGLQTVVLGDSSELHVGDEVMTIGNPLGELTFSLTVGAVSALDRQITFSDGVTNDVFQTDCAINAGNSGGPMFNSYGEVIGVATGRYNGSSVDNICFAIPINIVMPVIEDLIEKGYTTKPYLGVTVTDVNPQMLKAGRPMGAAVYSVDENGGAVVAGIRPNDIITAVDDTVVESGGGLVDALAACQVGQTVTLTVYRNGQTFTTNAVLGEMIVAIEY